MCIENYYLESKNKLNLTGKQQQGFKRNKSTATVGSLLQSFISLKCVSLWDMIFNNLNVLITLSAARYGDLSPFGRLLPALGDCFLALAIFHFGDFLGDFLKWTKNRFKTCLKPVLNRFGISSNINQLLKPAKNLF